MKQLTLSCMVGETEVVCLVLGKILKLFFLQNASLTLILNLLECWNVYRLYASSSVENIERDAIRCHPNPMRNDPDNIKILHHLSLSVAY